MRRRTRRPRNTRSRHDSDRYDRALIDALRELDGKALRSTVIDRVALLLELEEVDQDHRNRTDAARVHLVDLGHIYPVELGEKGLWELAGDGWNI